MTENIFPKVHNEGYKFIIIFALVTIILYFINGFLGILGLLLTIWCYYFFRDPERISIQDDNYLTSPADGVVIQIQETTGPKELQLENKKYLEAIASIKLLDENYKFFNSTIEQLTIAVDFTKTLEDVINHD